MMMLGSEGVAPSCQGRWVGHDCFGQYLGESSVAMIPVVLEVLALREALTSKCEERHPAGCGPCGCKEPIIVLLVLLRIRIPFKYLPSHHRTHEACAQAGQSEVRVRRPCLA